MSLSSWLRSAHSLLVPRGTKNGHRHARPTRAAAPRLGVLQLEDRTVPSTFTVHNLTDSGAGSLRSAVAAANANPGADLIVFAPGVRGQITLTSGELSLTDSVRIDGPGANKLAVGGNDASRVFNIGSGAAVNIEGLTITRGYGLLRGGGILNAGHLTLSHAVVADNEVVGLPGTTPAVDAFGGGILNTGTLAVSYTLFVGNRSTGGDGNPGGPGSTALGGAIMSAGTTAAPSSATVSYCTFLQNRAVGGAAGAGAAFSRAGIGGAIMNGNGSLAVSHSLFRDNRAVGGAGGGSPGSAGVGGAITNVALLGDAALTVSHCTLTNNRAIGGAAPTGTVPQPGRGGGIANYVAPIAVPGSVAAMTSVDRCTLLGNQAIGGAGPAGGTGQGGGIANEFGGILTVSNSLIALNRAVGGAGDGGNGGDGLGGGIFNGAATPFGAPTVTLERSIVALNSARGGESDGGSDGLGVGGGLYLAPGGIASADLTAILANDASTSDDDVFGLLI
jgi:hypothetical protein